MLVRDAREEAREEYRSGMLLGISLLIRVLLTQKYRPESGLAETKFMIIFFITSHLTYRRSCYLKLTKLVIQHPCVEWVNRRLDVGPSQDHGSALKFIYRTLEIPKGRGLTYSWKISEFKQIGHFKLQFAKP